MLTPPPVFGWESPNTRLLADNYATSGFYSYIPDLHNGDSIPLSFLQLAEPPQKARNQASDDPIAAAKTTALISITLTPWLHAHRDSISHPLISSFIDTIRNIPGTRSVGAIGFCWGGRYAILQARDRPLLPEEGSSSITTTTTPREASTADGGGVDAAYACHPSLLAVPEDLEAVTKPLSLALAELDPILSESQIAGIREVMAGKVGGVPWEVKVRVLYVGFFRILAGLGGYASW